MICVSEARLSLSFAAFFLILTNGSGYNKREIGPQKRPGQAELRDVWLKKSLNRLWRGWRK